MRINATNNLFICIFIVIALIIVVGCATLSSTIEMNPGHVYGNIVFQNTSTEIANHLSTNAVVAAPPTYPGNEPVRLYEAGSSTLATSGYYTPINTAPDASTYVAGSFDLYPNVQDTGSDFLVLVDSIRFNDGAQYSMGSYNQTSTAAHMCAGIMPVSTNPAGTQCDIAECAGLINIHFGFVGDPADLNAIDTNSPAQCNIDVYIEDPAGSGSHSLQARSGSRLFPISSLTGGGVTVPLLVRETPSSVRIEIGCSVLMEPGEDGFIIIPTTGRTPLGAVSEISSLSCGQSASTPPIDIPVERTAGKLRGYFDVSDHDEVSARISIGNSIYSNFYVQPPLVPAGSVPTTQWVFEGVPAGVHRVIASALVDGGDKQLMFPYRDGPTNLPVDVLEGSTTDIVATFVSKPVKAEGAVRLFDMSGLTDLNALTTSPFSSDRYVWNYWTSYVEALGDADIAINVPDAGSGVGGVSRARLIGSYDATNHEALTNYQLLLNGLSPETGSLDGTDAKATLWDIETLDVTFNPASGMDSESKISLGYDFHYQADVDANSAIQVPEQQICFGKIELTYQIDPTLGTLYNPYMSYSNEGVFSSTITGGTPYTAVSGYAQGIPDNFDERTSTARISATVPQGFQYQGWNRIYFAPPGATSSSEASYVWLGDMNIPHEGVVKCGSTFQECIDVLDEDGNYARLSITILDDTGVITPQYCLANDTMELTVDVSSDGLDVTRLAYVIDPVLDPSLELRDAVRDVCDNNPTAVLCTSCGPDPTDTISITSLPPGGHTIYACATNVSDCFVYDSYPFEVTDEDLDLQCSADFTVTLNPGETEIAATDPRIADNLSASIVGNCGITADILDDRPDAFQCGTTKDVQYTASGIGNCITRVTVECPPEHYLSYVEKSSDTISELNVYHVEGDAITSYDFFNYLNAAQIWVEYDSTGSLLGYAQSEGLPVVKVFDALSGASVFPTFFSSALPVNLAFRPDNPAQYAVVTTTDFQSFEIHLIENNTIAGSQAIPTPTASGMSRPEIAWSPAGDKLSAVYTVNQSGGNSVMVVFQWDVSGNTFSSQTGAIGLWPMSDPRPIRLFARELLQFDDGTRLIGSSIGINYVTGTTIAPIYPALNDDIDITDDGKAAVYIFINDLAPGKPGMVYGLVNLDQPGSINVLPGPMVLHGKSVAISSDKKYVAVATTSSAMEASKIMLYSFPDFTLLKTIAADNPHDLVFRPVGP
jgi:hypothetical protein